MRIKITSDSTCDLSPRQVTENDLTIIPLIVMKDGQEFIDGVTITPEEIFAHVANGGSLCSTAARSVGTFQEVFAKYSKEYDAVIHIDIGADFSSSYQNACVAAAEFPNVRVIDSRNLSTGQGHIVMKAVELSKTMDDLDAIVEALEDYVPRVEASFLLDRLDYMAKGGRCSSVVALGANLLHLKPCIEVKDGKMSVVKKYRGHYDKCLANYVEDRLKDRPNLETDLLFVTHTPVTDECMAAVKEAIAKYGSRFTHVEDTNAGCTVSCHCGPGTLGVLFIRGK